MLRSVGRQLSDLTVTTTNQNRSRITNKEEKLVTLVMRRTEEAARQVKGQNRYGQKKKAARMHCAE